MPNESASVKAIQLARTVLESIQGGIGLLKFSIESLIPTNGSPTEESKKWKIICSYFETLGSSTPTKFEIDVDLNINTVSIKKLGEVAPSVITYKVTTSPPEPPAVK